MKWIAYFGLALCVSIFTLASCAAPGAAPGQLPQSGGQAPPPVTITPAPEPPPEYLISFDQMTYTVSIASIAGIAGIDGYSEAERESGCKSPFPFDGSEAYARYPREHLLLWTFSVNFDLFSKEKEEKPLGCLRLYQRNYDQYTFDLIKNGNILVDTCELKPGVTFDSGSAIFDGTGYIACRMNLSDWIEKLSSSINLTLTQTSVVTQTGVAGMAIVPETFTSTHTYENFTITAAIVPTATVIRKLLPVVYYEPKDSNTAQPALVLISKKIFPLQLSGLGCDEIVMDSDEQVWWYDLRGSIEEEPTAYFQYIIDPRNKTTC